MQGRQLVAHCEPFPAKARPLISFLWSWFRLVTDSDVLRRREIFNKQVFLICAEDMPQSRCRSHVKPGRTFGDFCKKDTAGLFRRLENWLTLASAMRREFTYMIWVTVAFHIHGAVFGLLVPVYSVAVGATCSMVGLGLNIFLAGWKLSLRSILPHLVITHSLTCNFHKNKISLIKTHVYFQGVTEGRVCLSIGADPRGPLHCFSGLTGHRGLVCVATVISNLWVGTVEAGNNI